MLRIALDDLKLDRILVVYPGDRRFLLADRIEAVPLLELVAGANDPASFFKNRRR